MSNLEIEKHVESNNTGLTNEEVLAMLVTVLVARKHDRKVEIADQEIDRVLAHADLHIDKKTPESPWVIKVGGPVEG